MKRKKVKRPIHPELGLSSIRLNMSQRFDLWDYLQVKLKVGQSFSFNYVIIVVL